MPDLKVSALPVQGQICDLYYGVDSGVSRKFAGLGIFNVRDFGATGNQADDQTAAVQAAVDAAMNSGRGAIVFFPPGAYKVGRSSAVGAIHFNGVSNAGIRVVGCGLQSMVLTFNNQYVFDIDYGSPFAGGINKPVTSFEYLNIQSRFDTGVSPFHAITDTETCPGCIHISGGIGVPSIRGCYFNIWSGIGVFSAAQNIAIDNCVIDGNYDGTNADRSIGFFVNAASIRDLKMTSLGYGVVGAGSGGGGLTMFDWAAEVCGTAISVGYSPVAFLTVITP